MVSCLLLAAGSSQRFNSPKALAPINGKTVIEHLQNILLATPLDEVIIVLGAHQEAIKPFLLNHKRVKVVYNKDHKFYCNRILYQHCSAKRLQLSSRK